LKNTLGPTKLQNIAENFVALTNDLLMAALIKSLRVCVEETPKNNNITQNGLKLFFKVV